MGSGAQRTIFLVEWSQDPQVINILKKPDAAIKSLKVQILRHVPFGAIDGYKDSKGLFLIYPGFALDLGSQPTGTILPRHSKMRSRIE